MKKILTIFLTLTLLVSLTGCDAFRRLAGRPTSAELEQQRLELIAIREAQHQARIDSLRIVEKRLADSLATLDSLKQLGGTVLNPTKIGGLYTTKLDYKYYIVVGAFQQRSFAERLLTRVQNAGYVGTLISFRNGYNVVGICQSDDLNKINASLRKVKQESFCPTDVWILVNE